LKPLPEYNYVWVQHRFFCSDIILVLLTVPAMKDLPQMNQFFKVKYFCLTLPTNRISGGHFQPPEP